MTPRLDIYSAVHKRLRALLFDTLALVARCDADDAFDVDRAGRQVQLMVRLCDSHLAHENAVTHPSHEARSPGVMWEAAAAHDEQLRVTAELSALASRLDYSIGEGRREVLAVLHAKLTAFVTHSLEHMHLEETRHLPALWATHTDDELRAMTLAIVRGTPPKELAQLRRWMLPALSHVERVAMLAGIGTSAPLGVFQEVLGIARAHLSPRDFRKLVIALDDARLPTAA